MTGEQLALAAIGFGQVLVLFVLNDLRSRIMRLEAKQMMGGNYGSA